MAKVDPQSWDPPEYLPISDRQFLIDRAQTIHNVQQVAYLTMGQILLQVKEKFKNDKKVDGWWRRWIEEATPLTYHVAQRLVVIATSCRDIPEMVTLTKQISQKAAEALTSLPPKIRKEVVGTALEHNIELTQAQVKELQDTPEVLLAEAEEQVQKLQVIIAEANLVMATSSDKKERRKATSDRSKANGRLEIAIARLTEARKQVASLEKERTTQDLLMSQLQAQLRQQQVKLEEATLDPKAKRKRALAKTVVDATNGLDLILSAFDKYQVDKGDIGEEAIKVIERKMAMVREKLLEVHKGGNAQ